MTQLDLSALLDKTVTGASQTIDTMSSLAKQASQQVDQRQTQVLDMNSLLEKQKQEAVAISDATKQANTAKAELNIASLQDALAKTQRANAQLNQLDNEATKNFDAAAVARQRATELYNQSQGLTPDGKPGGLWGSIKAFFTGDTLSQAAAQQLNAANQSDLQGQRAIQTKGNVLTNTVQSIALNNEDETKLAIRDQQANLLLQNTITTGKMTATQAAMVKEQLGLSSKQLDEINKLFTQNKDILDGNIKLAGLLLNQKQISLAYAESSRKQELIDEIKKQVEFINKAKNTSYSPIIIANTAVESDGPQKLVSYLGSQDAARFVLGNIISHTNLIPGLNSQDWGQRNILGAKTGATPENIMFSSQMDQAASKLNLGSEIQAKAMELAGVDPAGWQGIKATDRQAFIQQAQKDVYDKYYIKRGEAAGQLAVASGRVLINGQTFADMLKLNDQQSQAVDAVIAPDLKTGKVTDLNSLQKSIDQTITTAYSVNPKIGQFMQEHLPELLKTQVRNAMLAQYSELYRGFDWNSLSFKVTPSNIGMFGTNNSTFGGAGGLATKPFDLFDPAQFHSYSLLIQASQKQKDAIGPPSIPEAIFQTFMGAP